MSTIPNIWLCLHLSASLTNLGGGLPRAAAQITYDTKLTLLEATIKQFFKLLNTYTSDVNAAEHLVVFVFICHRKKFGSGVPRAAAQITYDTELALLGSWNCFVVVLLS